MQTMKKIPPGEQSRKAPCSETQRQSHLFGNLPKVVDEADGGRLLQRVVDVVDVNLSLVEEVVEDVDGLHGWRALLLVAEDEVDPLVEVG